MPIYNADDIVDASLYAKKTVVTRVYPDDTSAVFKTFSSGSLVGIVYSYSYKNGVVWWCFHGSDGKYYYAKHETGLFDINSLTDQNILDEAAKAENNKSFMDTIFDFFKTSSNYLLWAVGILALFFVGNTIYKKTRKGKK